MQKRTRGVLSWASLVLSWAGEALIWAGFVKSGRAEYSVGRAERLSGPVLAKAGERSAFLVGFYQKTADFIKKIANIALILVVCCHKTAVKSTIAYGTDFKFIREWSN